MPEDTLEASERGTMSGRFNAQRMGLDDIARRARPSKNGSGRDTCKRYRGRSEIARLENQGAIVSLELAERKLSVDAAQYCCNDVFASARV